MFQNGAIILLDKALETRKELEPVAVVQENETISDVLIIQHKNKLFGGLILESVNHKTIVFDILDDTTENIRLVLDKDGVDLSGYVLSMNNIQEIVLLTLCKFMLIIY